MNIQSTRGVATRIAAAILVGAVLTCAAGTALAQGRYHGGGGGGYGYGGHSGGTTRYKWGGGYGRSYGGSRYYGGGARFYGGRHYGYPGYYYRPHVHSSLGLSFGFGYASPPPVYVYDDPAPVYVAPPVYEQRTYIRDNDGDDDRGYSDDRQRSDDRSQDGRYDDRSGSRTDDRGQVEIDVTNDPPAGCKYWDPYCNRDWSNLDDYTDHLQHKHHAQTIDVVERRSGDTLRTLEFVGGYWQVRQ